MLKKAPKSSQHETRPKKASIQCSVCNIISSTKTAFYLCDSGRIECENCHQSNGSESRQDSGDCVLEVNSSKHIKNSKSNRSKSTSAQTKNLASGDHNKCNKASKRMSKSESKINICKEHVETKTPSANKNKAKDEIETTVEYKNINYRDDKSSTCSLITTSFTHNMEYITEFPKLLDSHVCPRPVKCPVEECNKMIALDSVMLHFYFDHSKVPRMILNAGVPRVLQLKPNNISLGSQCLGIFLLKETNEKVESGVFNSSDCKSLLLMGAKMQMEKLKNCNEKYNTTPVSVRNICTQTILLQNDIMKTSNSSNMSIIKKCESYKSVAQNSFDESEMLLLWLCKQEDNTDSYNISVLRKDKKQGYNYIGEAIHIRNDQSPAQMYQRADCLMVRGIALNRLLDDKDQIKVLVNILD